MVATGAKLTFSLLFFGALYTADADITEWSTPSIPSAADGSDTQNIAENQAIDTTITTYVATTNASTVTYALTPAVSPFAVSTTGVLTITAALDYETTETYTLNIVATDDGGATGTATIAVTVTAVNEHDPVFSASYSPCIVDQSPADTTLTTVTATDQDTSQTLTYAMPSGNTNTDFRIDTSTGLIQVNTAKTLNKTATATYDLVVTAADSIATIRTATTTVSVTVADSCSSGTIVAVSTMMLIVSLFVALF